MRGELGLAAIRGPAEVQPCGAVLGVLFLLMLGLGSGATNLVGPEQFDRAVAVFAAELRIGIDDRLGDVLHLPERLIASANLDSAPLHFTLVDLLALDGHLIVPFPRPSYGRV